MPNDIQIQKIYDVNEEISSGVESLNGAELNENNEEDSTGNSDSSVNNYVEKEDILQGIALYISIDLCWSNCLKFIEVFRNLIWLRINLRDVEHFSRWGRSFGSP